MQFNIRYEKVERPAPVGGALVFCIIMTMKLDSANRMEIPCYKYKHIVQTKRHNIFERDRRLMMFQTDMWYEEFNKYVNKQNK